MRGSHRVVAVAYQGLSTFEFGIVVEVFGLPRPEVKVPWYRFKVCSLPVPVCSYAADSRMIGKINSLPSAETIPRIVGGFDRTGCASSVTSFAVNNGPTFCPSRIGPPHRGQMTGGEAAVDALVLRFV